MTHGPEIDRRLTMLDDGVVHLAKAATDAQSSADEDARDEALTFTLLGTLHLVATASVEQAHAMHRIANALEAISCGEQVRS